MKTSLSFFLCLLIVSITNAQPVTQFQKLFGGSNDDHAYGYNATQTSDGGNITAANSSSTNGTLAGLTNNGGFDGWIFKTDINGNITWQKLYGGSNNDDLYSVLQTADGGYIAVGAELSSNSGTLAGLTNNGAHDAWVMKLNASGNVVWQRLLGGSGEDYLYSINQTSDKGYIITGQTNSSNSGTLTGLTNHGGFDAWIIKLNTSGNTVWQKLLGGDGNDDFIENDITADGGYIIAGTEGSSSGSGTLTGITNHGQLDGWLVKTDASGNTTWQTNFGGLGNDQFATVQQTSDGGYITALATDAANGGGTFGSLTAYGQYDAWVLKTNSTGSLQWQKILGGTGQDFLASIKQTTDGGYILSGQSSSLGANAGTLGGTTQHGGYDGWAIKLDKAGNTLWQELLGGSSDDELYSIEQTKDQGFFAQGYTTSSNSGTLTGFTNAGANDAWIIKLEAPQVVVTSYDTLATCASTNTISYKITQDSAPYTVQLYRFENPYGNAQTTNSKITFSNLPDGSYYAIATSKGVTGKSKTVSIIPAPTNPHTTLIKSTQAKLNWNAVSCADYFSIQYRAQDTATWTKKKTNGNVTGFVLKNLAPSTTYYWKVAAIDSLNGISATSIYTDSVTFTTTASGLIADENDDEENLSGKGNNNVLIISPNPARNYFIIHYNGNAQLKANAMLYDENGKAVWSSGLISSEVLNGKQVNVLAFAKGVFYLKIINEDGVIEGNAKIVIAH